MTGSSGSRALHAVSQDGEARFRVAFDRRGEVVAVQAQGLDGVPAEAFGPRVADLDPIGLELRQAVRRALHGHTAEVVLFFLGRWWQCALEPVEGPGGVLTAVATDEELSDAPVSTAHRTLACVLVEVAALRQRGASWATIAAALKSWRVLRPGGRRWTAGAVRSAIASTSEESLGG